MANLTATSAGTVSATTVSGNGSGLTGLSASNISAGSAISRANVWSKGIIYYTSYTNNSRVDTPTSSDYTLYSFTFTKQVSGSVILVDGVIPTAVQQNGGNYWFIGMDGTRYFDGNADVTHGTGGGVSYYKLFSGLSTGSHTITIGWAAADGGANDPAGIVNPNSNEHAGSQQTGTHFHIWEMQA